ncbi:MAG: oligoendopeptidase F, partial [Calditrichia bacterium]|nr:oligoendopeptidase F [Calditrichia bacterium]
MSEINKTYKSREEIPEKYKWDVSIIYKTDKSWEHDYKIIKDELPALEKFKNKISESSEELFNFINLMHEFEQKIEKLYVYAHLKKDEDTRAPYYQELYQKSHSLFTKLSELTSFFMPEIMAMPEEKLKSFIADDIRLIPFKHYFEDILRMKKHTLSNEQEELLAMAGEALSVPGKVFGMLDNADMKYGIIT